MKKIRKFAAGLAFAGTALCVSPVLSVLPVAESVVLAEDEAITVEEGDAFEVSAELATSGYSYRLADDTAELAVLSEETADGSNEGQYMLNMLVVINTAGQQELIIEDENGAVVKSVSVNVTAMPGDDGGDTSSEPDGSEGSEPASDTDVIIGGDTDEIGNDAAESDDSGNSGGDNASESEEPAYLRFMPLTGGKITGKNDKGEAVSEDTFKPGDKVTLSIETDKGYVLSRWVVRTLDGRDVTGDMGITEDGTFTLPEFPIRITAELNYNLVHEIELLDVTETLEVGKPIAFTGHVKDNTDSRFFLLAEIWINEYDTKGITNSDKINEKIKSDGVTLLDKVVAGDKYNYSVMFMTTEGYEFADDVKLIYNGKEYTPTDEVETEGNIAVTFSGFLSFGEQTNPKETKKSTKTVTREETKKENVTQYVYNTYTYTTYQYVTRYITTNGTVAGGTVKKVYAPGTGDSNNVGVWIALAIAAGGGVVSGILVGRKRKRNK